ncbi:hypothetical protein HBI56_161230 [Parastagonospora nodorum]|nr:hypothetical protein HBH56_211480 [Parastagonospora nodorum]QRD06004.1 hypothetical protein JI435_134230 [Parastagonospora nodorum SN15]KAH3931177.1 hypothetical protein HBH54_100090 [Parastagonospora nodorum]KAH3944246.1 hypothetical protein HBH53_161560 [Parastagonospora nodorum]KAH3962828.1 hypothetical protein HBH52_222430 [Parastagonospora nodorum]
MEAPPFFYSAHEESTANPFSSGSSPHVESLLHGQPALALGFDKYVPAVRAGLQDPPFDHHDNPESIFGEIFPMDQHLIHRPANSSSWWPEGGAQHRPNLGSRHMPASYITPRAHEAINMYTPDGFQMTTAPITHSYTNMYTLGTFQMPIAPIEYDRTNSHGSSTAVQPVTTFPLHPLLSSRHLMRAFEVITGRSPTDGTVCNYTQEQVVQAVGDGNAYVSRGSVLNPVQAARVNGYVFNPEDRSLRRLDTPESRSGNPSITYPVQVDREWIIHVKIPRDLVERPFMRRKGGGAWFPPEGLLYMAVEHVGLHMDHFDVNGSTSPIYSQAAPGQVDIRLLGALNLTAYELVIWFPTHGRDWVDWSKRLAGNGWSPTHVARLANKARDTDETEGILKSTIENQFSKHAPLATRTETEVFSCDSWTPPSVPRLIDYHVRHLVTGVSRTEFPSGADRGPVTAAIEYFLDHPEHLMLKLGEMESFVAHFGLDIGTALVRPGSGLNLDRDAIGRLEPQLNKYRKLCEQRRKQLSS